MEHAISTRWLANPNPGWNNFPQIFEKNMNILYHYQSERVSCSLKWSYSQFPMMLTIDLDMVIIF